MARCYTLRRRAVRTVGLRAAPPPEPTPEPEPEAPAPSLDMLKSDLVALAEERGVDASGTKADIIERLSDG